MSFSGSVSVGHMTGWTDHAAIYSFGASFFTLYYVSGLTDLFLNFPDSLESKNLGEDIN